MIIVKECKICNTKHKIEVPDEGYAEWCLGSKHIQDAMPLVSASDRELLMSGVCDACFERLFGE